MEHLLHNKMSDYQLRYAAGKYFLLNMKQKGMPYERPLQLNSVAAELWELFQKEETEERITKLLSEKYGVPEAEISEDIQDFCKQLNTLGIL